MERIIERKSKLKISESNVLQISSSSILSHHENNVIDDYLINSNSDLLLDDLFFTVNTSITNIFEIEKIIFNLLIYFFIYKLCKIIFQNLVSITVPVKFEYTIMDLFIT